MTWFVVCSATGNCYLKIWLFLKYETNFLIWYLNKEQNLDVFNAIYLKE